jgi:hypothetical protein
LYNDMGVYIGRIDADGRRYDARGDYAGHLLDAGGAHALPSHTAASPLPAAASAVPGRPDPPAPVYCRLGDPGCLR